MARQTAGDTAPDASPPDLTTVLREWGRIGCLGFGGPPAHIVLFRALCVDRRRWLTAEDFEDAIATTNLLPGPGSTQMAIFCGWRTAGVPGAIVGGLAFIVPGLVLIIALAALFLSAAPPAWVRGAGAGAGAAVAAVAVQAGGTLLTPGWARVRDAGAARARWVLYLLAGGAAAALAGPWTVVVLLGCGAAELALAGAPGVRPGGGSAGPRLHAWPVLPAVFAAATAGGGLAALAWVAFKVGALSYGGGFVIIPLMQADAVGHHHWLTGAQFTSGVALGQVTPGPVVHTVAVVGYAARGVAGALLAAAVAFAPSFAFILIGGARFDRLRADPRVRRFLAGAGPAAIGAILGSAVPLALALAEWWQAAVLAAAAVALFALRRGVVSTLVLAGVTGAAVGLAGGPLPV
ncbi:chromate efflux transporter [Paraconexibacter antarcticus]|uniref:Chromate efflux transporter n=1 Tax=Paraconexibacter antarcticus TaxID=2949664 RepID=A0ABY5DYT5_9ACTN|nr:chromate efflux transporter [Paraconexibacter antarcticus]UTI66032.1 chromate efflux transporter [Paraconexibacter antarcticus]